MQIKMRLSFQLELLITVIGNQILNLLLSYMMQLIHHGLSMKNMTLKLESLFLMKTSQELLDLKIHHSLYQRIKLP